MERTRQEKKAFLAQPMPGAAEALFEYAQSIPVIDTHEHVPASETQYLSQTISFGDLFVPYITNDLAAAGMPFPRVGVAFHRISDDWDVLAPAWNAVKHGSYARALRITLQRFYGAKDLTRDNYAELLERISKNKTPGIYQRVFREACGIEKAVRCAPDLPDRNDPILVGNVSAPCSFVFDKSGLDLMVKDLDAPAIKSLDDLVDVSDRWMELKVEQGAIEFKSCAGPVTVPDRDKAEETLKRLLNGAAVPGDLELSAYVMEANARKAAQLGVPIAFHTGVWGDFRGIDVRHLIGLIMRNPDTRMDLYHLGIPYVRSCIQIVKNFPNAYLNLCWAHIVAPDMVVATLKEAIDMVPVNKVFAFGADTITFIEQIYGHLQMARENIALALGDRVDRNLMDLDDAKQVLKDWFYDNPKRFYGL